MSDKPAFDPNQPFQPVAEDKPAFDPNKPFEEVKSSDPSLLSKAGNMALEGIQKIGSGIDSVTGAPVRSAIGSLEDKGLDLRAAIDAYKSQFGRDPLLAPTGKQLAAKAGLDATKSMSQRFPDLYTDEPGLTLRAKKGGFLDFTPAGAAGLGIDMATDPVNYIPFGKASEMAGGMASKYLTKPTAKVAEALTGVPARNTEVYMRNLPEINSRINTYGPDLSAAADATRTKYASDIKSARQLENDKISESLKLASPESKYPISDIVNQAEMAKSKLNPNFNQKDIGDIDEFLGNVRQNSPDNMTNVQGLFDTKNYLNDIGSAAYQQPGQIFLPGKYAQRAAKSSASIARKDLNAAAPEIANANNRLSLLHTLEDQTNPNLIKVGGPDVGLMTAGSGSNPRNARNLKRLGSFTGTDMLGEAEKLSAQRQFTDPGLLPADTTGKSLTRMAVGGTLGAISGVPHGGYLGMAATSPAALKAGINTGAMAGKALSSAANSPLSKPIYNAAMTASRPGFSKDQILSKLQGTPFADQLAQAKDDHDFALRYMSLSQIDPNFRQKMQSGGIEQ